MIDLKRFQQERARNKTGFLGTTCTNFPEKVQNEWTKFAKKVICENDEEFIIPNPTLMAMLHTIPDQAELEIFPVQAENQLEALNLVKDESKEEKSIEALQVSIVRHTITTLARTQFNMDVRAAYQAAAHAVRDRLIARWDGTQQQHTRLQCKRVYYLSLEFLMGRTLGNATLNMGIRGRLGEALKRLGYALESGGEPSISQEGSVERQEQDAALGNGGLGRLAACFMDSLATLNYPAWGYGLRYTYGIFHQEIHDGWQAEIPDFWLTYGNPWEVERLDVCYPVRFYGEILYEVNEDEKINTKSTSVAVWSGGETVNAVAYDVPIPGFGTRSTINIRLWSAKPTRDTSFDLGSFNAGNYERAVEQQQRAESITSVLYPNDNTPAGKELRLKQQYFFVSATLQDIVRRFRKTKRPWSDFPKLVAIQLNDTHPTLGIAELQRILVDGVDEEGGPNLPWDEAWSIVTKVYSFTNHTVLPEAMERWPVALLAKMLPRQMRIIYDINLYFLQAVEARFPNDRALLSRLSIIEEGPHQYVRMAHLAIIGSHTVNGVAKIHSDLIKSTIFKDFVRIYDTNEGCEPSSPSLLDNDSNYSIGRKCIFFNINREVKHPHGQIHDKFQNVTNGITPRRWLHLANPNLSALISNRVFKGDTSWLVNLDLLKKMEAFADDLKFQEDWMRVKRLNKVRLAEFIREMNGLIVSPDALFDVQVKRIHEYKRQLLNVLSICYRYLVLKGEIVNDEFSERVKEYARLNSRVFIFGGKAAPGYEAAKLVIKLINNVADVLNADMETNGLIQVVFIPDYNVSRAEIIVPANDISQHISTAGTEASGTGNMKFVMNGGLIIGTLDGANVEIRDYIESKDHASCNDININPNGVEIITSNQVENQSKSEQKMVNGLVHHHDYCNLDFQKSAGVPSSSRDVENMNHSGNEECGNKGEEMMFIFGATADKVEDIRYEQIYHKVSIDPRLSKVLSLVRSGRFGNISGLEPLLSTVESTTNDHYLVSHDFSPYLEAITRSDAAYLDVRRWARTSILSASRMGYFTSDRSISEYATRIWGIEPCVPDF